MITNATVLKISTQSEVFDLHQNVHKNSSICHQNTKQIYQQLVTKKQVDSQNSGFTTDLKS